MTTVGIFRNQRGMPDTDWLYNISSDLIAIIPRLARDGMSYTIGPPMERVICVCKCGNKHNNIQPVESRKDLKL